MQAGTDAELIAATRRGDRDAFAQIIERYQRVVHAVAFSGTRDRAMADDVTQDAFVIAWRRIEELRETTRLAAWLCGIARNLARDARRRHRREVVGEADEIPCAGTPFHALSEAESDNIVATALGLVPDVYREPLVLYYYEERSVDDVARSLGISTATTNKRLSRGRRYLADHVAAVDRGLARFGPRAGLAASVLAIIAVTVPASHVDASPVKGSTMNKLSLAAIATATVVGVGTTTAVIATRSDAHAQTTTEQAPDVAGESCDLSKMLAAATSRAKHDGGALGLFAAGKAPALKTGRSGAIAIGDADCVAVGKHLAELEADTTHGADSRPDDATCAKCAAFYENQCESESWSQARRTCTLAAGDLINAHLCAGDITQAAKQAGDVPPTLTCPVLAQHLATVAQGAGLYADVTDFPQQIEAACTMGNWPVSLRQCFAAGTTILALQACIHDVK
jgi:RNA polymerase sigma factor (sigma-70 family)